MYLLIKAVIIVLAFTLGSSSKPYLVDISALLDESSDVATQLEVKRTIDKGLRENGVLVLIGHGLTSQLATDSFESARKLFELDVTEKLAVSIRNDNTSFGRGYLGFGDESGLSSNFEPKEGYSYGNPQRDTNVGGENLLALPNKWPSTLPANYRDIFNSLYTEKVRVAELIVSALSECFTCVDVGQKGGDNTAPKAADLNAMVRGGHEISLMRLFHYYHQQSPTVQQHLLALQQLHTNPSDTLNTVNTTTATAATAPPSMLGSSPHTDWGFLTLILADEVGGLHFLPKGSNISDERSWVDVPYVPGSLVVNGGDYLKLISRGVYHSPIHRVLSPGSRKHPSSEKTSSFGEATKSIRATDVTVDKEDANMEGNCSGANTCPDRYSFVFFYYPSYASPVTDDVLSHCTHYLHLHQQQHNPIMMNQDATISGKTGESEVASEGASEVTRTGAPEPNAPAFNTLLNLEGAAGATKPHLFGDYVIQKWKGVYRRDETY